MIWTSWDNINPILINKALILITWGTLDHDIDWLHSLLLNTDHANILTWISSTSEVNWHLSYLLFFKRLLPIWWGWKVSSTMSTTRTNPWPRLPNNGNIAKNISSTKRHDPIISSMTNMVYTGKDFCTSNHIFALQFTGFVHICQNKIQVFFQDFEGHKHSFSRP